MISHAHNEILIHRDAKSLFDSGRVRVLFFLPVFVMLLRQNRYYLRCPIRVSGYLKKKKKKLINVRVREKAYFVEACRVRN